MGDETKAMNPAAPEQSIFAEAIQRTTPEARAAYLDEACGVNIGLRVRIEALVTAAERAGDFLEEPPTGLANIDSAPQGGTGLSEKPGDRISRYKLLQQIGEGGCGVVYMAEQEEPVRRRVALKVIKLGMDTKSVIARFEAERQALAMMDHPNIAKVLDAGATETGRPFFVMELVRGIKITEYCDQNQLSTEERLKLFTQVCHAIQHAHVKGIIHRDIKPSNILVTVSEPGAPGSAKVIDFGIAKATTDQRLTNKTVFTAFEQFIGTPAYMSPEQAMMTTMDLDTRTDIYSLGVLLYELLTGETPFDGKVLMASGLDAMRRTIREVEPPRPSTRLSTLLAADLTAVARQRQSEASRLGTVMRGDLDWIAMKALEKERSRRYETASALAEDILRYLRHQPVTARPPTVFYLAKKLAQRNRGALSGAAAIFLALIGGILLLGASNARIRGERNEKDRALRERSAALEAARASEQSAREQLFISLQSQAEAHRHSGRMGQRTETLAALADAARLHVTADLRNRAIAAMALPDMVRGPIWQTETAGISSTAYSSDYVRSAHLEQSGTIVIRALPENRELQRLASTPHAALKPSTRLEFSPDGRHLARFGEGSEFSIWLWEPGESILRDPLARCSFLTFSSDGQWLVAGHGSTLVCFDLSTGTILMRWEAPEQIAALQFHPDNHRFAVGFAGGAIVSIYDVRNGSFEAHLPVGPGVRTVLAWHPGGELLAISGVDSSIQIWNPATGLRVSLLEGHAAQVSALSFHSRGEVLASASWDGDLRLWHASPGRLLMRVPFTGWLAFGRGEERVGVVLPAPGRAQLWSVVPSDEYHTFVNSFPSGEVILREGHISPDGALLALGTSDGVRLWNVASGREVAWLKGGDTTAVLFSLDGRELLTCSPFDGLRRWSLEGDFRSRSGPRIGSPRKVTLPFAPMRMARDGSGRTLAVISESAGESVLLDLPSGLVGEARLPHRDACFLALSTDGERLASSGWHSRTVKLWNTLTGKLMLESEVGSITRVFFTPNDLELIVARDNEFSFRDRNSLKTGRQLSRGIGLYPGYTAFTADGQIMALETVPGTIELQEVATGRVIAKLEDPHRDLSTWLSFSPDGSQLIVVARYAGAIHRWDLSAIRARLKLMKLEEAWPGFADSPRS